MSRQWFAVRTKARHEVEALNHFERQGFAAYLPRTLVRTTHARKVCWKPRPFFPGYLFLHLAPEERRWTTIRSTIGAIGAVHFGHHYPPVPDVFIELLKAREDEHGLIVAERTPDSVFQPGERVRVLNGPMQGLEGVFVAMRGEDRVMIMLDWLARRVKAELPLNEVIAAA